MRLLGLTIERTSQFERIKNEFRFASSQRLLSELNDSQSQISLRLSTISAKVARSAVKDMVEQYFEDRREKFEALPEVQQWSTAIREQAMAEARREAETGLARKNEMLAKVAVEKWIEDNPLDRTEAQYEEETRDPYMLRYSLLGHLAAYGPQPLSVWQYAMPGVPMDAVEQQLARLVSRGLVHEDKGIHSATYRSVLPDTTEDKEQG